MSKKIDTYKKQAISTAKKGANLVVNNPVKTAYVLGGLVGLYLIYKISTTTSKAIEGVLEPDEINTDIKGTGGNIIKNQLTITPFQASNYAQQLLDAMNAKQPFYGTDEDTIEDVFDSLQTTSDFIAVFNEFGLREYNGNNSPPDSAFWQLLDSYKPQNLVYWLKSELDPEVDKKVYNKVKKLVVASGFTF